MNIKGKVKHIGITQNISDTFRKRDLVIEYAENPQYPELIKFDLIQDKCDLVDFISEGTELEVHFNLKGREWSDPKTGEVKYFTSLQAWKLEVLNAADFGAKDQQSNNDEDDLIF